MVERKEENVQIGGRLKAAREAAGYTQERLAELVDVSAQFISGVERGAVGLSVSILIKICGVLLVSADTVLLGDATPSDTSGIVARLSRLPAEHVKNAEELLNLYLEGIAITQKNR